LFQFSLQRILDYRRQVRERIEHEMEVLFARINAERLSLESCRREMESWKDSLRAKESGQALDLNEIRLIYRYLEALEQRTVEHLLNIQKLNRELEEKRNEYLAASQAEKIMEKLKEKEWTTLVESLNKQERAFLDEVASRSHGYGVWE
jgi:flagellar FliJ protein